MLDRDDEYDRMAECEQNLWWYRALHERTANAVRRHFKAGKAVRILDAGCGTGGLMLHLQQLGFGSVEGFDLSDRAVTYCRGRSLAADKLDLREMAQHYSGAKFDVIVSNDTICYLNADELNSFVASACTLLEENGLFVFNAPAFDAFGGTHDLAVGIQKRFRKSDIQGIAAASGFVQVESSYWPFLLSPVIFSVRSMQRLKLALGLAGQIHSDVSMPSPWINRLLLGLCRFEQKWLKSPVAGSSLFVVLKRR
ncbi:hypothetical protein LPB72_19985 [Hydrogenophaga crassostreae]|uniref:Methyltransferase domain-containing protein n=1 Tax=Hydrogenophaga crassostreae TaxID=1763535 RepID=A0A167GTH0_9BURK|nr:class I SAM-dependent methyltransferase [Hydrogenophaga crassostreae]AOW11766.1 hypothetical protein LPB072_01725 [Hydrogenophaga crassostreae]OAD39858.1 hypothetical protein LPB72_19985 [Hydrogenophaga crassostreae]